MSTSTLFRDQSFSHLHLRVLMAVTSLLLSTFALLNDDIINSDGILYIKMAEAFIQGGLPAMADLYNWPFFAFLIASVSQLTGLHPETSAALLNAALFVVFTDALFLIARHIVPNSRQLVIATVLILLFYSINDYRDFIIRDVGYWAFLSLALLQFIHFLREGRWHQAILWQIYGLIALLFRVEGIIFLLAMPIFLIFIQRQKTLYASLFQLYSLLVIMGLMVFIAIFAGFGWTDAFSKLSSITSYLDFSRFLGRFEANSQIIADQILHPVAEDEAGRVLFFGLIGMLATGLVLGLSAAYLLILLLAWQHARQPWFTSLESRVIGYFLLINIGILTVFCLQKYFVTSRYCVMAFVAVFLLALPKLTAFIDDVWIHRKRGMQILVLLLLIYSLGDFVHRTNSKNYIPETAKWASENLPTDSKLLTLDEFSAYYFEKYAEDNITIHRTNLKSYKKYDYLLVVEKGDNKILQENLADMPVEILFSRDNQRGNKATVYRVVKP